MAVTHPEEAAFLAAIAAAPDDALPRLVFADRLEERNDPRAAWVRDADIWEWMKPDAHDPVPGILRTLQLRPDYELRREPESLPLRAKAATALRQLGPTAVDAVRGWLLANPDHFPSAEVQSFVAAHPPATLRSVPDLQDDLAETVWVVVWLAVVDLGFHCTSAAPAVPAMTKINGWKHWCVLLDSCDRCDRPVENAINRTLAKIGPKARKAVPYLAETMWMHEETSAEALIAIQADPDEVMDHLNTDDDWEVRSGIKNILPLTGDPVPFLVRNAERHVGRIAYMSVDLLAEMGSNAAAAIPYLLQLSVAEREWDSDFERACAARAVEAIRSGGGTALY
jgi:uncharacterized protein (TIGR02996 family)